MLCAFEVPVPRASLELYWRTIVVNALDALKAVTQKCENSLPKPAFPALG